MVARGHLAAVYERIGEAGPIHPEGSQDLLPHVFFVAHAGDLGDHLSQHQVAQVRVACPFARGEPEPSVLPEHALDESAPVGHKARGRIHPPDWYRVGEAGTVAKEVPYADGVGCDTTLIPL
jgi:hypothetical protein